MKVSIIVPVYNSSNYLRQCLDSLMKQTLQELEVIAIDDNSKDNSLDILREYENKYSSKLKVLHNEKNLGQSIARNKGLDIARGEYIGFVDSDDYVSYKMFQTMYEGAKENGFPEIITTGICFVKDDYYLENNFSFLNSRPGFVYNVLEKPDHVLMESPSVCNKLFRRDVIKNERFLEGKMWEDVAFSFSEMFNANRILTYNNMDYFYRRRSDAGVSSKGYNVNKHLIDIFDVADEIEAKTKEKNRFEILKKQIKTIQIVTCLQRIVEVMGWPIADADKDNICQMMSNLIIKKYGDFRQLPIEELSSKVGFLQLEKIKELIIDDEEINLIDLENTISSVNEKSNRL